MRLLRTTKQHKKYWANRNIDWQKDYLSPEALNHPHRKMLVNMLNNFPWISLIEIGCASGANLVNIVQNIPGKQVGGIDISPKAIEVAKKNFSSNTFLNVGSGDDILMSDNGTDIVLSDMTLLYVGSRDIKKYVKEMKRISRNYVLLCELHSDNWWDRLKLKIGSGYTAHNWKKLLEKEDFYDIVSYKLKDKDWPGGEPQKTYGYVFLAKVPKIK